MAQVDTQVEMVVVAPAVVPILLLQREQLIPEVEVAAREKQG